MVQLTTTELALAIKLTSVQGYGFGETAKIMSRNGSGLMTAERIREEIKTRAPAVMAEIEIAANARFKSYMCGVAAAPPGRRFKKQSNALNNFVIESPIGKSEEQLCWAARQAGFDCNLTDIRITAKRCDYVFEPHPVSPVGFYNAIIDETCLWPLDDVRACGTARQVGRYCGPHYCRSLGKTAD